MTKRGWAVVALVGVFGTIVFFGSIEPRTGKGCQPDDAQCLKKIFLEIISRNGVPAGFTALKEYDQREPVFRPYCFPLAMELGSAIASSTSVSEIPITHDMATCNYGFFQEYPRVALLGGAAISDMETWCTHVGASIGEEVPDAEAECFRGIGRALPFIAHKDGDAAAMADFAARSCADIAHGNDYLYCLSGVFNMLARESVDRHFGLEVHKENPMWLCDLQEGEIRARCVGNWKWTAVSELTPDESLHGLPGITSGYEKFHTINAAASPEIASQVVWALAYDEGRHNVALPASSDDNAADACNKLPEMLQADCVSGYGIGLAKHGSAFLQHRRIFSWCDQVLSRSSTLTAQQCFSQPLIYLRGQYGPTRFKPVCNTLEKKYGLACADL